MISVAEATARLLSLVEKLPSEDVPLRLANGRVLARRIVAPQPQPPFPASAMDGYAIAGGPPRIGDTFRLTGTSAAGHPGTVAVRAGEAIRIFTGGAMPDGAVRVVIQEDVEAMPGSIRITSAPGEETFVRPAGGDYPAGFAVEAGTRLGSRAVTLLASMGHAMLAVVRKPQVAILMTGDELRAPGEPLQPGQIYGSNGYGLAAMLEDAGAAARLLPIARDDADSLAAAFALARGADLIVTVGGASVGDHDLVAQSAGTAGLELAFHRIAMRPGKPLLAGSLNGAVLLGLPGNPVSSIVCGVIFMLPMVHAMLGLDASVPVRQMPLSEGLPSNGPRQHYMRGIVRNGTCRAAGRQDSSLLSVLNAADILLVRPPGDPARATGDLVDVVDLPR